MKNYIKKFEEYSVNENFIFEDSSETNLEKIHKDMAKKSVEKDNATKKRQELFKLYNTTFDEASEIKDNEKRHQLTLKAFEYLTKSHEFEYNVVAKLQLEYDKLIEQEHILNENIRYEKAK